MGSNDNKKQIITFTDKDRFKPILYGDLYIPSWVNGFSIGVEFIYNWFLSKFPKNFFKTIHVANKSPYDDFRRFNVGELTKREKPACLITSNLQYDFNDNMNDLNYYGVDTYIRKSDWQRSFFKDARHGLYISYDMETMLLNFNIRVRVQTRSEQLDLYNRIRKVFRIGCTETIDLDMDIHIPYELIFQLACLVGAPVDVNEEAIIDPYNFVAYLNRHSQMPILYKMRYINGKHEFFVRMRNLPTHLNLTNPLDADDGENDGQMMNNFNIDMQIVMRLPIPSLFLLYNEGKQVNSVHTESSEGLTVYSMKVFDIPDVNYKGWDMFAHSNYAADENEKYVESINIRELFKAPVNSKVGTDLDSIIDIAIKEGFSPDNFIDIALYTSDTNSEYGRTKIDIDWENRVRKIAEDIKNLYFYIAIYIDRGYVNNKVIDIDKANDSRLKTSRKRWIDPDADVAPYDTNPVIEKSKYEKSEPIITYPQYRRKKPV